MNEWMGLLVLLSFASAKSPHILFIVADDLGWNDVGFHNPGMITPHIDLLAKRGVILNHSYVNPLCTPSRHSFMTGVYPFKAGLQHYAIGPDQAACSPLQYKFLPEKLKELGYSTHIVGKWHLGYCNWLCTPSFRGFDTFLGYYNAQEDYYSHELQAETFSGQDFRYNERPVLSKGNYSTLVYGGHAKSIIRDHNLDHPLFLYLSFQSPHVPLQVPEKYTNLYPHVKNTKRKLYSGMVTAMDEAIGQVVDALVEKGIHQDTLIIFTSDNGGNIAGYGNNYPLRGGKETLFEGGTRAVSLITGNSIQKSGYTYDGIMHAVDWMPTILSAAGGSADPGIDGIDMWDVLQNGGESRRTEFVYNIDYKFPPVSGLAAIRVGDYKLISGYPGPYQGWYPPDMEGSDEMETHLRKEITKRGPTHVKWTPLHVLFNLKDDPDERNDIASVMPDMVEALKSRLEYYNKQLVPAMFPDGSPAANPKYNDGFWSPGWC